MIDISDNSQLKLYLAGKNLFPDCGNLRFHLFPGGVSGNVVLASDGETSLIVKQALPKLKVKENWECDPGRMLMEHRALEVYARITPENVPRPVFYDMDNHIMVREAAPEDCSNWKEDLLSGRLDFQIARKTTQALVRVHNMAASDEEIRGAFRDNKVFYDLRVNPYIEWVVAEKYPELKKKAAPVIDMLMNKKITLVHGDYSPKNILVSGRNIFILDMEVAHTGHPAFDLAFFFTMFVCKSVKNKLWADSYLNMLAYMYDLYFQEVTCMNPDTLRRDTLITLAFIILARVDGKSPAEYITSEDDKNLIRQFSCNEINRPSSSLAEMISRLREKIS
jgi:tRNA A-37 threonylcarbamoyl transferase component Bud32